MPVPFQSDRKLDACSLRYRRKKTRCPGEQPACSLCVRLGQICSYGDGSRAADSDQSVVSLTNPEYICPNSLDVSDWPAERAAAEPREQDGHDAQRSLVITHQSVYFASLMY